MNEKTRKGFEAGAADSARAQALRAELHQHAHAYYVLDAPTIADATYDALFQELQAIEARLAPPLAKPLLTAKQ